MELKDVEKLAELARIEMDENEKKDLLKDLRGILEYVGQIQSIKISEKSDAVPVLKNVFRDDGEPHAPEIFTDDLLTAAPQKQDGYVKVKKIL